MQKVLSIIKMSGKFATVHRAVLNRRGDFENDAEHSYQLAMTCWAVNKQYSLNLSDELVLKFALVHDLVELYAGDTDAHGEKEKLEAKKENEKKALAILQSEFTEHADMLKAIENYQSFDTPEAQLVNIVDKLIPCINIHDSNDPYCQTRKLDFATWKHWLLTKVRYDSLPSELRQIVDEAIIEIESNYKGIFYSA